MTSLDWLRVLVASPLLAWLPGWLAVRAFAGEDGPFRDRSERIFGYVFVSLLISAGLATFLAELGLLSLPSLLALLSVVCLVLGILDIGYWVLISNIQSLVSNTKALISNLQSLVSISRLYLYLSWSAGLLIVLALAAVLFARPAETALVMDDAGVYVMRGLGLADSGGLDLHDPMLSTLTPADAEQLLPFVAYESSYIRHVGAFHIWQWGRGVVRPSFFHLPSIWMAVLALLAGSRAVFWATPLAGLVAVAGLALLGRRLFGAAAGLAAALLLTVSFPQTWFARYPTSEMFMQAWLLGGLFLLAVFLHERGRYAGVVAGLALGQLFLIRVDAFVAVLAIGLCFGLWFLRDRLAPEKSRVGSRWFLVPLGLTFAWAGLHAALFATPYLVSLMHIYLTPQAGAATILAVACLLGLGLILWQRPAWLSGRRWSLRRARVSPRWVIGLVVAGVAVGVAGRGFAGSLEAVQWLSWYLSPVGLLAALIGLILLLRQGVSRPAQVLLLIAVLYAWLYLPAPRTRPVQPWAVRRFVPAVLPALTLLVAYAITRFPMPDLRASLEAHESGVRSNDFSRFLLIVTGPERLKHVLSHVEGSSLRALFRLALAWLKRTVRVALVAALAFLIVQPTRSILGFDEEAGTWDQMQALAQQLEPGAVVLFTQADVGSAVAPPLTYLYDRPAFVVQTEAPDRPAMERLVERWRAEERTVYVAATNPTPWVTEFDDRLVPAGDFEFRFPRLVRTTHQPPRETATSQWAIDFYRFGSEADRPAVSRLDMAAGELLYLREGFYERETAPDGTTFRWTEGEARVALPTSPAVRRIRLRVSGPPAGVASPTLTLLVDGQQAGAWEVADGFVTLEASVPAGAAEDGNLDVVLRSGTWVPQQAGRGSDERRLGVAVDWIVVED